MKVLSIVFLGLSFHALAQGDMTPAQQHQIMVEAQMRAPASADIDPAQAQEILEKLKQGKEMREAQSKFIEELDQEN